MNSKTISRWFLLLMLLTCVVGCSDDDLAIDGCFTSEVIVSADSIDVIRARITDAPEGVTDTQPHKGTFVQLSKRELGNPNIQEGDFVNFQVISFEILPLPEILSYFNTMFLFTCKVKPCK